MSYNCDTFKIKTLQNLVIPLKSFYNQKYHDSSWIPDQPKLLNIDTSEVEINCGCGQTVTGILTNKLIQVTELEMSGEGSGTFWEYFEKILKTSTGILIGTRIWEGGDSVDRIFVINGDIRSENVEL
jgi:hypothetical protein